MNEHDLLVSVGGVPTYATQDDGGGDWGSGEAIAWNFGILPPSPESAFASQEPPTLYGMFPALRGKWDGKSTVNHHEAVRRVLGRDLRAHNQPKGTCGGRAGSRSTEILQCNLIASGKRAKYHDVSHAWLYAMARKEFGMLGGGDGVAGGSIPPVLAKYGAVHREESGDLSFAGPGSDDLAARWGGRSGPPAAMLELAKDNLVTALVQVKSAAELADGLAAGGVCCCSDMQGYAMTRDENGFCSPRGTWAHYHVRSGVRVAPNGRAGFQYDQSWGDGTPGGPPVPGCPGNVFLVDWDTQDQLCRTQDVHVLFAFSLWDLEQGGGDPLPWIF